MNAVKSPEELNTHYTMPRKTKVLVTGAGSKIGRQVLNQLISKIDDYDITVFDYKRGKNMAFFERYKDQIKVFYGDLSDPRSSIDACRNQDFVIHLLSLSLELSNKRITVAEDVNVQGTRYLLENLETYSQGAYLVYLSTVGVYGDRLKSPMISVENAVAPCMGDYDALTKLQAEKLIQDSNLEWTILRPAIILNSSHVSLGSSIFNIPLQTHIEFIHIEDLAGALIGCYENKNMLWGQIFNVGGGENNRIIYKSYLRRMLSILGLKDIRFPNKSFSTRNGIGGYFADGYVLNDILSFRKYSLEDYFEQLAEKQKFLSQVRNTLLKGLRTKNLLSRSEPLKAYKHADKSKMKYFF